MIDLTEVLAAVILLITALISAVLIPYLKRKMDAEQLATLRVWVRVAVEAAEQIFRGTSLGAEKKAYVIGFLRDHGFNIDAEKLDSLVEAAVLELKK